MRVGFGIDCWVMWGAFNPREGPVAGSCLLPFLLPLCFFGSFAEFFFFTILRHNFVTVALIFDKKKIFNKIVYLIGINVLF